jgi:hypothetical protein
MPKKSNGFDILAARRSAIEKFARAIGVASTDDFPPFLIAWYWHNPNSKDPTGALIEAARRMHGTITEQRAGVIIEEADSRPKIQDRDQLAKFLGLSYAMRKKLDIRVIGACDVGARARKAIQKQERRKREALRRRAKGARTRADFLANSKSREQPWKLEGKSRRTWYRRQKAPALVPEPSSTRLRLRKQDVTAANAGNGFALSAGASTPSDESFLAVVAQVHAASIKKEDGARTCANGGKGGWGTDLCHMPPAYLHSLERMANGCPRLGTASIVAHLSGGKGFVIRTKKRANGRASEWG